MTIGNWQLAIGTGCWGLVVGWITPINGGKIRLRGGVNTFDVAFGVGKFGDGEYFIERQGGEVFIGCD